MRLTYSNLQLLKPTVATDDTLLCSWRFEPKYITMHVVPRKHFLLILVSESRTNEYMDILITITRLQKVKGSPIMSEYIYARLEVKKIVFF